MHQELLIDSALEYQGPVLHSMHIHYVYGQLNARHKGPIIESFRFQDFRRLKGSGFGHIRGPTEMYLSLAAMFCSVMYIHVFSCCFWLCRHSHEAMSSLTYVVCMSQLHVYVL